MINNQQDIDKIYLFAKDPYEDKYQYLINKRESVGINHLNDSKAFIECSNDMLDVYKNIDNYNPDKENKILIVFDDKIADTINNKKLNSIVTEFFSRGRKSSDINTKDFIEIYRKCTDKPYSFLVIDTTLPSNNSLKFRKTLIQLMMTINNQIKDEKLQYSINREAAKISALSSGKLHKYEYLTGEDILRSNQQQIIEQTKFTYSPLGKTFDNNDLIYRYKGKFADTKFDEFNNALGIIDKIQDGKEDLAGVIKNKQKWF